jgi:proline racemase
MLKTRFIDVIYTHTEGEPTCIVHAGVPYPHGTDILGKRRYLETRYDWLRRALMQEPRGHRDMFGVFVTPPSGPDADAGMIWMDGEHFMHMCGHGTIGLSMAMVACGLTPATESPTRIRYETTAGPVTAEVSHAGGRVEWCRFENVPAFVAEQDVPVDLPDFGRVTADVVFGGNYFGIIKWDRSRLPICPENGSRFSRLGVIARDQLRRKVSLRHPTQSHITELDLVTFYHEATRPGAFYRCVHVFGDGQMDRSPGGTGTSAMMAMFEARGQLEIGQRIRSEGLLGSGTFEGELVREISLDGTRAVVPTIKGTANIVGYAKWLIDPDDPVGAGFVVS